MTEALDLPGLDRPTAVIRDCGDGLGAPLDSVVGLEIGVVAWVATLFVGAYLLRIAEKDNEDSAISLGKSAAVSGGEKV